MQSPHIPHAVKFAARAKLAETAALHATRRVTKPKAALAMGRSTLAALFVFFSLAGLPTVVPAERTPSAAGQKANDSLTCTVASITDGDTLRCVEVDAVGRAIRVRLSGISARERDGSCSQGHPCPAATAEAATGELVRLAGGDVLQCEPVASTYRRIAAFCPQQSRYRSKLRGGGKREPGEVGAPLGRAPLLNAPDRAACNYGGRQRRSESSPLKIPATDAVVPSAEVALRRESCAA